MNKKAYERGISPKTGLNVMWTSGVVKNRQAHPDFIMKSNSNNNDQLDRDIFYVSGKPSTWYFDGVPHVSPGYDPSQVVVMKAEPLQCGDYNLLPGVASYNKVSFLFPIACSPQHLLTLHYLLLLAYVSRTTT